MKKFFTLILTTVMLLSVCSPFAWASDFNQNIDEVKLMNDKMEKEISDKNIALSKKYSNEINTMKARIEDSKKMNSIDMFIEKDMLGLSEKIRKESLQQEIEIATKYGYVLLEDNSSNANLKSDASDLEWTSEVKMYHKDYDLYRYTVDWDLNARDAFYDTYDIAGIGITNSSNFDFSGAYGKTFSMYGESCYVDNSGNSSGDYPNAMSKRAECSNGVSFNVSDAYLMHTKYVNLMVATSGRMTVYVHKKSTSYGKQSNKFIASYNHNYKTGGLTASIDSVSFSSSGAMSVTYSKVHKSWQRASGGKTIWVE